MKVNEKILISIVANAVMVALILLVSFITVVPSGYVPSWAAVGGNVIYRGNTENKNITLMFNVYWGTDEVNQILDILQQKEVKATFFIGGSWADDNTQTLKKIAESGNEIGTHGYFHKDCTKLSREKNIEEIKLSSDLIEKITGIRPNLFAPPSGAYNKNTVSLCNELGYKLIMWSKDTIDWRDKDENICYSRAVKNPSNGDLILMHPMAHTVKALSKIIDFYKQNGYNIVTVSKNIA